MNQYYYTIEKKDEREDWQISFRSSFDISESFDWVAQDAAEYDHDHCDGWEAHWPQDFFLYDENHVFVGKAQVDREYNPDFVVHEVERDND